MEYQNNTASSYFPEKVQAEIDRVLSQSEKVSTAARESMPYTNAVIHGVQRFGDVIPMHVPREVTVDTTLNGYHLAKVIRGSLTASDLQAYILNGVNLNWKSDMFSSLRETLMGRGIFAGGILEFFFHLGSLEDQFKYKLIGVLEEKEDSQVMFIQRLAFLCYEIAQCSYSVMCLVNISGDTAAAILRLCQEVLSFALGELLTGQGPARLMLENSAS